MDKIHIYCMPGLGANPKIFENIILPKDTFELHFLQWKIPLSIEEPLEKYAIRMSKDIIHKNPVLLGVSFGGILMQEISKIITFKKIILISTIKSHHEFPNRLKLIQRTKVYKFSLPKLLRI